MIRIVTACHRPDVLASVRNIISLESNTYIVNEAADCQESLELLKTSLPDIVLLSLDCPNCDSRAIGSILRSKSKQHVRGIAIISSRNKGDILRAIRLGCSGAIVQDAMQDSLAECIRKVYAGETWFDPVTTMMLMQQLSPRQICTADDRYGGIETNLTRAQRKIVLLMGTVVRRAQDAEEASRAKSRFVANLSHELRTLLNSIMGFSALVLSEAVGSVNEKQRELLQDNLHCSRELRTVINDLLDLAKIEAGKMEVSLEHVDPVALMQTEVVDVLRGTALLKGVSIGISGAIGSVITDAIKFKKIVHNFVSNAIKYSPPDGRIEIRISGKPGQEFMVEVLDQGPGIAQDKMELLFNRFQQGDAPAAKDVGTGLGLALSKEVAELLGGRVGVKSILGKGSTFYVVLPVHGERARVQPRKSYLAGIRPRILVVEDESAERLFLRRALARVGYRVDLACHLQEATKKCQSIRYDAITLDLVLGEDDGTELLKHVGPLNKDTPVIVVSALRKPLPFYQARVHAQLHKPILPASLVDTLSSAGITPRNGRYVVADQEVFARRSAAQPSVVSSSSARSKKC